jgi:hypothetical protein
VASLARSKRDRAEHVAAEAERRDIEEPVVDRIPADETSDDVEAHAATAARP